MAQLRSKYFVSLGKCSSLFFSSSLLIVLVAALNTGCSSAVTQSAFSQSKPIFTAADHLALPSLKSQGFLPTGSVVLSMTLPKLQEIQNNEKNLLKEKQTGKICAPVLGYIPNFSVLKERASSILEVDPQSGVITLKEGGVSIASAKTEGSLVESLAKKSLFVVSVANNPLWRAPDSYFTSRGLSIPKNTKDLNRLRRGALGEVALFLSDGQVIHSGRWSSTEVGGLRVAPSALRMMAEKIKAGTEVLVSTGNVGLQ